MRRVRDGAPADVAASGAAELLLCTEGELEVEESGGGEPVPLPRGAAALVTAETRRYRLTGEGTLYRATPG